MIIRPSYLHNGISYTVKMIFLFWIRGKVNLEEQVNIMPDDAQGPASLIRNNIDPSMDK